MQADNDSSAASPSVTPSGNTRTGGVDPTSQMPASPDTQNAVLAPNAATEGDLWQVCGQCGVRFRIDHSCSEMIERMADEAKRGYDPEQLTQVCVNCGDPIEFVPDEPGSLAGQWRHAGDTFLPGLPSVCLAKRLNAPVTHASPRRWD